MTRGSVLSDAGVIEKINKDFSAVEINITDEGFPEDVPALDRWKRAYERTPQFKVAFTTSVVIGSDGKDAFGTSGCGHKEDYEKSAGYHPDKYLKFLEESLDRTRRGAVRESAVAITEAARCDRSRTDGPRRR